MRESKRSRWRTRQAFQLPKSFKLCILNLTIQYQSAITHMSKCFRKVVKIGNKSKVKNLSYFSLTTRKNLTDEKGHILYYLERCVEITKQLLPLRTQDQNYCSRNVVFITLNSKSLQPIRDFAAKLMQSNPKFKDCRKSRKLLKCFTWAHGVWRLPYLWRQCYSFRTFPAMIHPFLTLKPKNYRN